MFETDRDTHSDFRVWELACEVCFADQFKHIFNHLIQFVLYPAGRIAEELIGFFNKLRELRLLGGCIGDMRLSAVRPAQEGPYTPCD